MTNKNIKPVITPGERWERGIEHHAKSLALFRSISHIDFIYNDDYFGFKSGGDGDNGEALMYLLDIYFEDLEE